VSNMKNPGREAGAVVPKEGAAPLYSTRLNRRFAPDRGTTTATATSASMKRSIAILQQPTRVEYVQMPGKMTKSILRPPFRPPQVPATVRSSRLSCGKSEKRKYSP
jgi:hypothetical protein